MLVYHGSILEIPNPDTLHSKRFVDFGIGFYVTTFQKQAENWAFRQGMRKSASSIVNIYDMKPLEGFRIKRFDSMNREWLRFVCDCRSGKNVYVGYDAVIGNVADDDVFKCVNMFMEGAWDENRTIQELKYYQRNDQIALLTQNIIDNALTFIKSYEVTR